MEVKVDSRYGHWIEPGVCDNRIGYFEMPGARIVYRLKGSIHSLGIASMISWRGSRTSSISGPCSDLPNAA